MSHCPRLGYVERVQPGNDTEDGHGKADFACDSRSSWKSHSSRGLPIFVCASMA